VRLLVTGGAGFIGSNLVRHLLRERPDVEITNLDALTYAGNLDNLADIAGDARHRLVEGDICDAGLVASLLPDCDAIVHLAAESHVDRSICDASPFIRTNVAGTQVLLDAAVRCGGRRFLMVSTDEVYGSLPLGGTDLRFTEKSPLKPSSPYAASKTGADLLALSYHRTHGLDVVVTRCSNNFGPRQFPEKVIPLFVTNLLSGRKLPLYGDGLNVRDWIHVDDHCEALIRVLEAGRSGEVYNIGADNEHSNLDLTHRLLEIMGFGEEFIERVPDRPGHDRRYAMDSTRIGNELGWCATRSAWPEALEHTVRWYADNRHWWRRVRSGEYGERSTSLYGDLVNETAHAANARRD